MTRDVVVDGLRIEYTDVGDGDPLFLLHGGMDDHRSWRWQLEGLCDAFRVLAWDQPGCGRSDDPPEHWTVSTFAMCAASFLRAIGVERANVLGLSWGSTVALVLADEHPDCVSSLALASSYLGWGGTLSADEVAARVEQMLAEPDPTREELVADAAGYFGRPPSAELLDELVDNWLDNTMTKHPSGYRAMVRAMAAADLRDVPPRIRVPTLIIHGEHDHRSPLAGAQELHERISPSQLVVIPGAGHVCNAEAPNEFNQAIRAFLGSHGPDGTV